MFWVLANHPTRILEIDRQNKFEIKLAILRQSDTILNMKENLTVSPVTKLNETVSLVSNCCWRKADGEVVDGIGRCSKCKEMASFVDENDEESYAK